MPKCPKCGGDFQVDKTWVRWKVTPVCTRCGLRWRTPWKRGIAWVLVLCLTLVAMRQAHLRIMQFLIKTVDISDPFWERWLPRIISIGFLFITFLPLAAVLLFGKRMFRLVCDDLCKKCGYDLRGIDADECPECGTAVSRRSEG